MHSISLVSLFLLNLLYSQTRFVLPGSAGSPPKILTFDEVRDAIKNVEDMQLAHEIAINPDFRLQPYDPPESSLEKRIKTIMQDAFWDLLREQLNSDPPQYDHAIALLGDIKEVCLCIVIKIYNETLFAIAYLKFNVVHNAFY